MFLMHHHLGSWTVHLTLSSCLYQTSDYTGVIDNVCTGIMEIWTVDSSLEKITLKKEMLVNYREV